MYVAVAVPRIKRFDGHGDQKITLTIMAGALAARRMAHAIDLMERMRDVVRERALLEYPLMAGGEKMGLCQQQKHDGHFPVHKLNPDPPQNFTDTDRRAAA